MSSSTWQSNFTAVGFAVHVYDSYLGGAHLAGRLQLGLLVYYCDTSLLCVWRQCHDKSCITSAIEMSDICMQANAASGLSGPVGGNMSCVLGCRWQDMVTLRGI